MMESYFNCAKYAAKQSHHLHHEHKVTALIALRMEAEMQHNAN